MTPTKIARDALAGQLTPLDALALIAGMEEPVNHVNGHYGWQPVTNQRAEGDYWIMGGIPPVFGAPHADSTPAITDEVVERCLAAFSSTPKGTRGQDWMRAALEEFVRQTRPLTHPEEIRRATEQAAREAAMAAVRERDLHTTVYAQTADDEAGRVAWATGEPRSKAWLAAKIAGWEDARARWGKQEDVG